MSTVQSKQLASLGRLAQLELEARTTDDVASLRFMAANDIHKIIEYDHALFWRADSGVSVVSGGILIDPAQPQIRYFNRLGRYLAGRGSAQDVQRVGRDELPTSLRDEVDRWLQPDCLWVPLTAPRQRLEGALFVLRAQPFTEGEMRILARLGSAFGSAMLAAEAACAKRTSGWLRPPRMSLLCAAAATALLCLPIRISVLAEAKIVPREPKIIAAPIDGVIRQVPVRPDQPVARGQLLFMFDDGELAAARVIAEKRVQVLSAEQARAEQSGFRDSKARAEIALLHAKLAEGEAELAYAHDRHARTAVHAPEAGIAMFDDAVSWVGRPVRIGERVMSVADPGKVRLEIALAVEDALIVNPGAEIEFFMAVAPSEPVRATLSRVSYDARLSPGQTAVFTAEADFEAGADRLRLGLTGTAKVYGETVTLFYALMRKPLAALRRLSGF